MSKKSSIAREELLARADGILKEIDNIVLADRVERLLQSACPDMRGGLYFLGATYYIAKITGESEEVVHARIYGAGCCGLDAMPPCECEFVDLRKDSLELDCTGWNNNTVANTFNNRDVLLNPVDGVQIHDATKTIIGVHGHDDWGT